MDTCINVLDTSVFGRQKTICSRTVRAVDQTEQHCASIKQTLRTHYRSLSRAKMSRRSANQTTDGKPANRENVPRRVECGKSPNGVRIPRIRRRSRALFRNCFICLYILFRLRFSTRSPPLPVRPAYSPRRLADEHTRR